MANTRSSIVGGRRLDEVVGACCFFISFISAKAGGVVAADMDELPTQPAAASPSIA
jgi:hypothetical protein